MTSDTIWQFVRYVLLLAFGPLTTKGYLSSDQTAAIIGALGTLFTVGWGIYVKYGTKATTAVHADKATTPTVSPATGVVTK